MAWSVEVSPLARKQLDKLDAVISRRIFKFLSERVGKLEDPHQIGEQLQGNLSEFWRYRVGDYRIICSLENDRLVVLVLRIGHRREIYKR
ncbi:MAG: type II toxin-antitoxin system RelE/ParE family toxin [Candidatus Sulfotelmatobacter sp.]|jgi:mRNA interferase RelE/StbE